MARKVSRATSAPAGKARTWAASPGNRARHGAADGGRISADAQGPSRRRGGDKNPRSIVSEVLERFPVKRLFLVAGRGLLSYDNIGELEKLSGKDGRMLKFILAVPAR